MSDKAKIIIDELCQSLPKLNDEQQVHVIGVLEGMAIMAKRYEAQVAPVQEAGNMMPTREE